MTYLKHVIKIITFDKKCDVIYNIIWGSDSQPLVHGKLAEDARKFFFKKIVLFFIIIIIIIRYYLLYLIILRYRNKINVEDNYRHNTFSNVVTEYGIDILIQHKLSH